MRNLIGLMVLHADKNVFTVVEEGGLLVLHWGYSQHLFTWPVPCGWTHRPRGVGLGAATWGALFSPTRAVSTEGPDQRSGCWWVLGGWAAPAHAAQGREGFLLPLADPRGQSRFPGWEISPSFFAKPGRFCKGFLFAGFSLKLQSWEESLLGP